MVISLKDIKKYLINKEHSKIALKLKEREDVLSILKGLTYIWQEYKIQEVYLYGGFVNMSFYKYSDIDIAIKGDIDYEKFLRICSELNRHFKRDVDVRLLDELPFKEKVKKEGILIYERKNTYSQKRDIKRQ